MFGYITPTRKNLSKEDILKYRRFYCGICHDIRSGYGKKASVYLRYDMVFLALLLTDLYNEDIVISSEKCTIHPVKEHEYAGAYSIKYSADVNIILAYYALLDHVKDDGKDKKKLEMIQPFMESLKEKYPGKTRILEEKLAILDEGEKNNSREAESMAATFGEAIAPFFDYVENSFFSHSLLEIGSAIGRFSYLRDAYEDRAKDEKKGSYNPLIGLEDDEIGGMLLNAASDASVAFESLPLDDNINLLRNILYGGIWKRTKWESGEWNS